MRYLSFLTALLLLVPITSCAVEPYSYQGDYHQQDYGHSSYYGPQDQGQYYRPSAHHYDNYYLPPVINIQGETYIKRGSRRTSDSGFFYREVWYERSYRYHPGEHFVVSSKAGGDGFWQHSKFWIPAHYSRPDYRPTPPGYYRPDYGHPDYNRPDYDRPDYTNNRLPQVINIQGDTYIRRDSRQTSESGFYYQGIWYERSYRYQRGVTFVETKDRNQTGFWQDSKYWVPAGSSYSRPPEYQRPSNDRPTYERPQRPDRPDRPQPGIEKPDPSQRPPAIINIQGETYILQGRGRQSGSGFEFNGNWYARSNDGKSGVEYRATGDRSKPGFWQHGKYWTR